MTKVWLRAALGALLTLAGIPEVWAQGAVLQSGSVVPGDGVQWLSNGIIADTGQAWAQGTWCGLTGCTLTGPFGAPSATFTGPVSVTGPFSAPNFSAQVGTNAALKALTAGQFPTVLRAGFTTAGDGGAEIYNWSPVACSLNGGQGDNGSQVAPNSGVGCWIVSPPAEGLSLKAFGALGNGVSDDTALMNTAFASGFPIIVPNSNFFSGTGVTIPGNANVSGASFLAGSPPYVGSTITCALSVAVCVTAGSNNNTPVTIKRLVIARATGTIPSSGAECLEINGADGVTLEDVACYRHSRGFHLYSDGAYGTIFHGLRLYTCAITDSHFVVDGWPVARVEQSYFGCNGAFDVVGNNFIEITGGDGVGGPNTVNFTNNQFNLGTSGSHVTNWLSFQSLGADQGTAIQDFEFYGNHVETAQNVVASDGTVTLLTDLVIQGGWMVGGWEGTNHVLALNAATIPDEWKIGNVEFDAWTDLTLAPSTSGNPMQFVNFNHNIFQSNTVSVTGNSTAAKVDFSDNIYLGNVTVAGQFQYARFTGTPAGGSYSNTASGLIASNLPNMQQTWTPEFVGATTTGTTTYATQVGQFDTDFSKATVNFNVATSAALSGFAGNVGIGNLPKSAINVGINEASCAIGSWAGITLDSGYTQLTLQIGAGSAVANIAEVGSALGSKALQPSNFTGAAVSMSGTCTYRFQ